jgi:hypothetical protein
VKLTDLEHGKITPVQVMLSAKHEQAIVGARGKPLRMMRPTPAAAVLLLDHGQQVWELRGKTIADDDQLHRVIERGLPRIVHMARPRRSGEWLHASLQIHEFQSELIVTEPLELGVDEQLLEKLRTSRRLGGRRDLDTALGALTSWFLLADGDDDTRRAVCITLGRGGLPAAGDGFWLHGKAVSASVRRADGQLLVRQVTPLRRDGERTEDPMRLMRGELRFADATVASRQRPIAARELDALVRSADSYLGRWEEINQVERRLVANRARSLGALHYQRHTRTASGHWRFHLAPEHASEVVRRFAEHAREEFAAAAQLPPELDAARSGRSAPGRREARADFTGELVGADADAGYVELRSPRARRTSNPPDSGFLFVSELGDKARIERRTRARDAISSATCPMPLLGLVLEGNATPHIRGREHASIPSEVLRCFRAAPTPRQLEALRVAVNTPDIALIQGPPGTGKTDVIAALERWLAQLTGTRGGIAKSMLLTSYQHDAVDNAAGRSRVLEMPALRVGGRRRDMRDGLPPEAISWGAALASELQRELDANHGDAQLRQAKRKLQKIVRSYLLAPPTPARTAEVLEDAAAAGADLLRAELRDRLREHAAALRRASHPEPLDEQRTRALATATRALRTSATAFADDGASNARRLLARLGELSDTTPEDRELLVRAGCTQAPQEDLLAALAELRDRLLDALQAEPGPPDVTHDFTARALLNEAASEAGTRVRNSRQGAGQVLMQLIDDLEHDPRAVVDAVNHYTAIVAATCQQSASAEMTATAGVEFDTVIVDEAARANPLDLMIPLAQARQRIVLVGDHRQLPHVLEPEVERELGADVEEETRRALQQSLFERLFEQFQRQEREGGPRRVVTLDTQFRMHPRLGDFISRAFYEPHGTQLHSGRPQSDFEIALPGLPNAPAAWVDLPRASHGDERRAGFSKSRPSETAWIAERLAELMEAEPERSFGVISFYKAQVQEIERALEGRGMLVRDDEGELTVAPTWRELSDPVSGQRSARLRIGTVDAFQGREFDVVLLSLTRASAATGSTAPSALSRRYGHLMLANRLCVAMSRQRRMLVVIGDREMTVGAQARAAVPALVTFREMCEEVRDGAAELAVPI